MNIDLSGRLALVTGGSGDLGRVIVRTLAACGADVAIHCLRNREQADRLRGEVEAIGRRAVVVQGDVGAKADVSAMHDAITAALGEPDIVVANAVLQYQWKQVLEQDPADYEGQFRSCVLHAVNLAQAFAPAMIRRRRGRIIGINTECSVQNNPSQSAYVSGKRGMDGVLRCLAKEIGQYEVTVNQVAPGWMISDRDRAAGIAVDDGYSKHVPMRRRGVDQDIANAVAFLASDLAGFINGAMLPVCGGNVMVGV